MMIEVTFPKKNIFTDPSGAGSTPAGEGGDMFKAIYDPTGVEADAFDMGNMTEAANAKVMTAGERQSISQISSKADLVNGIVPDVQLPAYKDVLMFSRLIDFPALGNVNILYLALETGLIYRFTPLSNPAYTEVSPSLALGETVLTAYRGDRGKTAFDHSQAAHAPADAQKNSDITKAEIEAKLTGEVGSHSHVVSNRFTINAMCSNFNPAGGNNYYFGCLPYPPLISLSLRSQFFVRTACTLKVVELIMASTTGHTAEPVSIYLVINNTNEVLIATIAEAEEFRRVFSNTNLNVNIAAGDGLEFKIVFPIWENPMTTVRVGGYLYFET